VRNFALVNIHEDVKMQGYITYTGSSSMEVTIDILAARPDRDDLLAETKFIMVARAGDKAGKVPGLLLANDEVNSWFYCCYLVESCCKQCCVPASKRVWCGGRLFRVSTVQSWRALFWSAASKLHPHCKVEWCSVV
jgi:hypothetical protein